ncbi:beta-ketoacyl-[acyl-carrier-protein] synthase family protein [Streptomyces cacaoi]|uniref:beta-ketoacyl-[acyl-carrier-protein] synthase family protein n=1 Tax=Streptomyces cacaoi TaxID=1898 RepID=UPI003748E3E5
MSDISQPGTTGTPTADRPGPGDPDAFARDDRGRYRVAITGIGVKTPAGCDVKTLFETVLAATPVTAPVTNFDASDLPVRIACEVRDFEPLAYVDRRTARRMDRVSQLGFAAAMDAFADAGSPEGDPARRAVVFGTGTGGAPTMGRQAIIHDREGADRVSALMVPMLMPNATGAHIAMELGWTGPNYSVSSACASGTTAVGDGARLIRYGEADTVLAGGGENSVNPWAMACFCRSGALSARNDDPASASRPFDAHRDGYVMGEGSTFLVLERLDRALARGARIHGEVVGFGLSSDAHHLTAPRPDGAGAVACMRRAIEDSGLAPEDIGHVNAHGTGTGLNDAMEARALATVFPSGAPPVTSAKGVFGHLMGAAGAAEAALATLSAAAGVVPPTANHESTDEGVDLDVVVGAPRNIGRRPVLSNSFGFGGHNASLVLSPFDGH